MAAVAVPRAVSGRKSGRAEHHTGRFVRWSGIIRRAANATPLAVCWRCGHTLQEHRTRTGKPDRWQAGHTVQGSTTWQPWTDVTNVPPPGDWLAPEARSCNSADGARIRNTRSSSAFNW